MPKFYVKLVDKPIEENLGVKVKTLDNEFESKASDSDVYFNGVKLPNYLPNDELEIVIVEDYD